MTRTFDVLTAASEETFEAARWYAERDRDVARAFRLEVERAFERIDAAPETWPPHHHGTRRFLLTRFPYEVVYRVTPDVVLVVAVAHLKRRPGYWKAR